MSRCDSLFAQMHYHVISKSQWIYSIVQWHFGRHLSYVRLLRLIDWNCVGGTFFCFSFILFFFCFLRNDQSIVAFSNISLNTYIKLNYTTKNNNLERTKLKFVWSPQLTLRQIIQQWIYTLSTSLIQTWKRKKKQKKKKIYRSLTKHSMKHK